MSKRAREEDEASASSSSEAGAFEAPPPPSAKRARPSDLASRLHALAAGAVGLGIREGETSVDIDELRPRIDPKTGKIAEDDQNRSIPTREGYVRDWNTGRVLPEQRDQPPFNPAYMEERDRRLRAENANPDVRFFKLVSSLTNEEMTHFIDTDALVDTERQREVRALALEEERLRRTRTVENLQAELEGYKKILTDRETVLQNIRLHVEAPLARFQRAPAGFKELEMLAHADSAAHMFAFPFYMRWQYREVIPLILGTRRDLAELSLDESLRFIMEMDDRMFAFGSDAAALIKLHKFLVSQLGTPTPGEPAEKKKAREHVIRAGFMSYILARDLGLRQFVRLRAASAIPILSHGQHLRTIWLEYLRRGLSALPGFAPQWLSEALPADEIGDGTDVLYLTYAADRDAVAINSTRLIMATRIFMPEYTRPEFLGIKMEDPNNADINNTPMGGYVIGAQAPWVKDIGLYYPDKDFLLGEPKLSDWLAYANPNDTTQACIDWLTPVGEFVESTLIWTMDGWQTRETTFSLDTTKLDYNEDGLFWRAHTPWLHDWEMACVALERMQSPRLLDFAELVMPNRANGPDRSTWVLFQLQRRIARNDTEVLRSARYRVSLQEDVSGPLLSGDMQDYYHYTLPFFNNTALLYIGGNTPNLRAIQAGTFVPKQWPMRYDIYGPGTDITPANASATALRTVRGWKLASDPKPSELDTTALGEALASTDAQRTTIAGQVLFYRTLPALVGQFGQQLSEELRLRLPAALPSVANILEADKWPSRIAETTGAIALSEEERAQMLRFLLPFDEVGADPAAAADVASDIQERSRISILHDLYAYNGLPRLREAAYALRIASFCPLATMAYHLDYVHQVFVDDSAHRKGVDDYRKVVLRLEEQLVEVQFPRVSATSATHLLETIQETHVFTGAEISDPMIAGRIYLKPAALTLLAAGSADLQKWGWGHVRLEQVTSLPLRQGESPARQSIAYEFAQWLAVRYMRIQLDFPEVYKTALQRIEAVNLQQSRQRQCWQMLAQFFGPPDSSGDAAGVPFRVHGSASYAATTTTLPAAGASWTLKLLS